MALRSHIPPRTNAAIRGGLGLRAVTDRLPGLFEGTEMPTTGWWEALWPDPARVLHAIGLMPGMDVVDLCSGDGWFTLQIAKIARHVVAVDLDAALIGVTKLRLGDAGVLNCEYAVGDAYELATLVPRRVDLVFMANAFHGVPDRPRLARAVRAVLKASGRFAIVNWHRRPREETTVLGEPRGPRTDLRMSPDQTIAAIEPAGLKPLRTLEVLPYHYGIVFERTPD
jgi:SAM-dependent methyltransferase